MEVDNFCKSRGIYVDLIPELIFELFDNRIPFSDINKWNPVNHKILATDNFKEVYEKGYRFFRKLYESTKDIMKEMDK